MTSSKQFDSTIRKFGYGALFLIVMLLTTVGVVRSQDDDKKIETIDATASGTSTQLGTQVNIKITIRQYSTEEDRQTLVAAFKQGQNKGLVDALSKMPSVGRIAVNGTLGYDLAYIRLIPTQGGRRIRFATNRLIRFGEAYNNTPSRAFDLTAGEFNLSDSDPKKNTGVLYPAAQLIINKEGQLEIQLRKNHWNLVNIIDWNKAGAPK
jgi:hypothetical protein